jgi:hypothetical protein
MTTYLRTKTAPKALSLCRRRGTQCIATYDRQKRGEFGGPSQRDLADQLGVHESQLSRDERNEYRNITLERAAANS